MFIKFTEWMKQGMSVKGVTNKSNDGVWRWYGEVEKKNE